MSKESEKRQRKLPLILVLALVAGGALAIWHGAVRVLETAPFRVGLEGRIPHMDGTMVVTEDEVRLVFERDIGHSLASVDVSARLRELEMIPWVRTARVVRIWPNRIAATIEERDPVAYLRIEHTNAIRMIDAEGTVLDLRRGAARPLPLLTGIADTMPASERRLRVALFLEVMAVFGERVEGIGQAISEVDLSQSNNAIVLAKYDDRMIWLQMGDRHLRHRLDVFLTYIDAWKSEYGPLHAVDLRFERQVTLTPTKVRES